MYSMLLFLLVSYALEDTSLISQRPDNNIILYCFLIKVAVNCYISISRFDDLLLLKQYTSI